MSVAPAKSQQNQRCCLLRLIQPQSRSRTDASRAPCATCTCISQVWGLLVVNANAIRPVLVKLSSQLASSSTPTVLTYSYSIRAFSARTCVKAGSVGLGPRVILPHGASSSIRQIMETPPWFPTMALRPSHNPIMALTPTRE